jgi:hypothetical protein
MQFILGISHTKIAKSIPILMEADYDELREKAALLSLEHSCRDAGAGEIKSAKK